METKMDKKTEYLNCIKNMEKAKELTQNPKAGIIEFGANICGKENGNKKECSLQRVVQGGVGYVPQTRQWKCSEGENLGEFHTHPLPNPTKKESLSPDDVQTLALWKDRYFCIGVGRGEIDRITGYPRSEIGCTGYDIVDEKTKENLNQLHSLLSDDIINKMKKKPSSEELQRKITKLSSKLSSELELV